MTEKDARRRVWRISILAALGSMLLFVPGLVRADDAAPEATSPPATEVIEVEVPSQGVIDASESIELNQDQIQEMLKQAEEARRREQAELRKAMSDPLWRPTHRQTAVIKVEQKPLNTFCLNIDGNILAGCGGSQSEYVQDLSAPDGYRIQTTSGDASIQVYSPEGSLLKTWKIDVKPESIAVAADGTIFVGGDGRLAKLDQTGKVLATADSPVIALHKQEQEKEEAERKAREEAEKKAAAAQVEQAADEQAAGEQARSVEPPKKSAFRALFDLVVGSDDLVVEADAAAEEAAVTEQRVREVNGIAATQRDLFVVCPMRKGYGFAIWRVDHELQNPEQIVTKLRGCCGQMDISSHDGDVFVCENSRKRVTRYDRDGKTVSHFGKSSRSGPEGFGSCCNPMNLCFAANGDVVTSESGPPDAVKRFTQEGDLVSVLALPKFAGGCLRVTVAVSPDERQVYVLNTGDHAIHVFADRRYAPTHEQVAEIQLQTDGKPAGLHTFCATADGKLLAACGGQRVNYIRSAEGTQVETIEEQAEIRVLSLDGAELDRWPLEFKPEAINVSPDGTVFVGGEGQIAKLTAAGKVALTADTPSRKALQKAMENIDEVAQQRKKQAEDQAARYQEMAEKTAAQLEAGKQGDKPLSDADKKRLQAQQKQYEMYATMMQQQAGQAKQMAIASAKRKMRVSAIAATKQDVFVCCSAVEGYGYDIYRLDHDLTGALKIVEGLRGCCGQMDIQAYGTDVYAAENSRGRVVRFDRDGNEVASWGKKDRKSVEGFGSCCNPMNLRFGADGMVYTSEASFGRIKRFSPEGEFLGLVGTADIIPGCKNVAIGVSPDGAAVFLLDITRSQITVLKQRADAVEEEVVEQLEEEATPSIFGGIF